MKRRKNTKRKSLQPSPSFMKGVGSVLNMAGNSKSSKLLLGDFNSDFNAIMYDWQMIGRDFKKAMKRIEEELESTLN